MKKFIPLFKVDVAKRLVYGIATAEVIDKSNEICDYATTKPYFEKWSQEFSKNTDGKSLGNLRSMHNNVAAGKLTSVVFDDENKRIEICAKVVDDAEWEKVLEGVYTGFSQGGAYVKRWPDKTTKGVTRFTAEPSEVSLVDNPCVGIATFEIIKADGETEMRKFKTHPVEDAPAVEPTLLQKFGIADTTTREEAAAQLQALLDGHFAKAAEPTEELPAAVKAANEAAAALEASVAKAEGKTKPAEDVFTLEKATGQLRELAKTDTWDVRCALDALASIECLISSENFDAMVNGTDQGTQVADLRMAVGSLKRFIAAEIMEADKVAKAAEMAKNAPADAAMTKMVADLDAATKANAALTGTIEAMTKTMNGLAERMKSLEAQPAEPKGALFAPVGREQEHTNVGKADAPAGIKPPRNLSPSEARASFGIAQN